MQIQGLGQAIPQTVKPKQSVENTQASQAPLVVGKGIRPWASLDEEHVDRLRYDQAQGANKQAISQYQDVSTQLRRQEVDQLFGVDLYA